MHLRRTTQGPSRCSKDVSEKKFYDVEETLTTLGTGEALITVLSSKGVPIPVATRLIPPRSSMSPIPDLDQRNAASQQVKKYATDIDRQSAREMLAARVTAQVPQAAPETGQVEYSPAPPKATKTSRTRVPKEPPGTFEQIMKSPVARTVAGTITRGIMGALLGTPRRRKTTRLW